MGGGRTLGVTAAVYIGRRCCCIGGALRVRIWRRRGRSGGIDYAVLLVLERTALARMGGAGAAAWVACRSALGQRHSLHAGNILYMPLLDLGDQNVRRMAGPGGRRAAVGDYAWGTHLVYCGCLIDKHKIRTCATQQKDVSTHRPSGCSGCDDPTSGRSLGSGHASPRCLPDGGRRSIESLSALGKSASIPSDAAG